MEHDVQMPGWSSCLFRPARYKIIRGGRGSGKSWAVARALVLKAAARKLRILCTRELQLSISESCHELLSSQIRRMGLAHRFEILTQSIRGVNGSEFLFIGVGSNPEKVMSMEGINIAWCEQAERMSERSWEILTPTVREPGSELWATLNPDEEGDPTYQRFVVNTPPDCISLEVNWEMNPWFPPELERERAYLFKVDAEAAANVWSGQPRSNQSAQILRGKYSIESFTVPTANGTPLWDGPYYGSDFGFANDPTTLVKCWVSGAQFGETQGTLYVEHEAWGIGVEIANTPALFDTVPDARRHLVFADCARPETISHIRNAGFRIEGCEKWKGSVEDGVSFLRSFEKIIIHERCKHAAEEARLYSFKRDRLTGITMPDVADKNNHVWDAVRYALGPMIRRSKLSVYGDSAEGITFGDGDLEQRPYLLENPLPCFVSIEATTARVVVFVEAIDDGRTLWITREFYWDSMREGRQSDFVADLLAFMAQSQAKSRPRVILKEGTAGTERLFGQGVWVSDVTDDDAAVIAGIRVTATALAQKKLRVHERCANSLRELRLYRWDGEKQALGVEEPEKKNSFSCDALRRLASEIFQPWRLM